VKRRLQRTSPLGKAEELTGSAGYIRAGRLAGRGAVDTGPAAELEGSGRDNVVIAASGLVSVGGVDELWDVPNSDDTVRKENCGFCVNTGVDEPVDVD
jgi:hypothetical protein